MWWRWEEFWKKCFPTKIEELDCDKEEEEHDLEECESREIDIDVGGGGFHVLNRELKPR